MERPQVRIRGKDEEKGEQRAQIACPAALAAARVNERPDEAVGDVDREPRLGRGVDRQHAC